MTLKLGEEYALKLSKLASGSEEIAKKSVYAGAGIVADAVKKNLTALPEERFRRLGTRELFSGLPARQKRDLEESFGITPIQIGGDGYISAKVGFDGYGSNPTKKYPKGVPNQLLARAVESGSSVRQKTPFVRPAVTAVRKKAEAEMGRVVEEEIQKTMKE